MVELVLKTNFFLFYVINKKEKNFWQKKFFSFICDIKQEKVCANPFQNFFCMQKLLFCLFNVVLPALKFPGEKSIILDFIVILNNFKI